MAISDEVINCEESEDMLMSVEVDIVLVEVIVMPDIVVDVAMVIPLISMLLISTLLSVLWLLLIKFSLW